MVNEPWKLLADSGIKEYLTNCNQPINDESLRILFLELFQRIKALETENHTLKTLLFLQKCLDEDVFQETRTAIKEFLKVKDEEKSREATFWEASGIPFVDWVNFVIKGKFESHH